MTRKKESEKHQHSSYKTQASIKMLNLGFTDMSKSFFFLSFHYIETIFLEKIQTKSMFKNYKKKKLKEQKRKELKDQKCYIKRDEVEHDIEIQVI